MYLSNKSVYNKAFFWLITQGEFIMLIGYNTNVRYGGKVYHVQTEDSGLSNPVVVTLLYFQGAILRSKKTSYADLIGQPDLEERLRDTMKQQHKDMIRELIEGKCTGEETGVNSGEKLT